jgi:hypothetical protein
MSHPDTTGPTTDRPEPEEGRIHDRIAILALAAIGVHLLLRLGLGVDEFLHIGRRMTPIALESAVGGLTNLPDIVSRSRHRPSSSSRVVLVGARFLTKSRRGHGAPGADGCHREMPT